MSHTHYTHVTQGDHERLKSIDQHARNWRGPISFAVLVHPGQEWLLDEFLKHSSVEFRTFVDVHLCVAGGPFEHYPINKMRNLAIEGSSTDCVSPVHFVSYFFVWLVVFFGRVSRLLLAFFLGFFLLSLTV